MQSLAREVEAAERRKDAQLLREVQVSLPDELSDEEAKALVEVFVAEQFVKEGMIAAVAIHSRHDDEEKAKGGQPDAPEPEPEPKQRHAHITLSMRTVGPDGFGKKETDWNKRERLEEWRAAWAEACNTALAAAKVERQVDHRSLKARRQEVLERAEAAEATGQVREAQALRIEGVRLSYTPLPHLPRDAFRLMQEGAGADHPAFGPLIAARRVAEASKRKAAELAAEFEVKLAWEVASEFGAELEAIEAEAAAEAEAEGRAWDEERVRADRLLALEGQQEERARRARSEEKGRAWAAHEARPRIAAAAVGAGWGAVERKRLAAMERERPARAAVRAAEGEQAFDWWDAVVGPVLKRAQLDLRVMYSPTLVERERVAWRIETRRREAKSRAAPALRAEREAAKDRRMAALGSDEAAAVVRDAVRRSARQRAGLEPRRMRPASPR